MLPDRTAVFFVSTYSDVFRKGIFGLGLMLRTAAWVISAVLACSVSPLSPGFSNLAKGRFAPWTTPSPRSFEEAHQVLPVTVRVPETEGSAEFLLTGPEAQKRTVVTPDGKKTAVELKRGSGGSWVVSCEDSGSDFRGAYTVHISNDKMEKAWGQTSKSSSYAANQYFAYNSISARAVFRFGELPTAADNGLKAAPLSRMNARSPQARTAVNLLSVYGIDANLSSGTHLKITFYHAGISGLGER